MAQAKTETIKIVIKSPTGPDVEKTVEKSYSLKKLKMLPAVKGEIPENRYRVLRVDGKQLIDDDECFEVDSVVQVHYTIRLWVRLTNGNSISLLVDPMDTMLTVKKLIAAEMKVPVEEQLLRYDVYVLDNDMFVLDYGFDNEDTIMMERYPRVHP